MKDNICCPSVLHVEVDQHPDVSNLKDVATSCPESNRVLLDDAILPDDHLLDVVIQISKALFDHILSKLFGTVSDINPVVSGVDPTDEILHHLLIPQPLVRCHVNVHHLA